MCGFNISSPPEVPLFTTLQRHVFMQMKSGSTCSLALSFNHHWSSFSFSQNWTENSFTPTSINLQKKSDVWLFSSWQADKDVSASLEVWMRHNHWEWGLISSSSRVTSCFSDEGVLIGRTLKLHWFMTNGRSLIHWTRSSRKERRSLLYKDVYVKMTLAQISRSLTDNMLTLNPPETHLHQELLMWTAGLVFAEEADVQPDVLLTAGWLRKNGW